MTTSRTHYKDLWVEGTFDDNHPVTHKGLWRIGGKEAPFEGYETPEVWRRCHGEKIDARPQEGDFRPPWKCAGCAGQFDAEEMTEGKPSFSSGSGMFPPPHEVRVNIYDQARDKLTAAVVAAGLDPHDNAIMEAIWESREGQRDRTPTSMLAAGFLRLGIVLERRAAVEQTQKAVADLRNIKVGHEFVGFPEATKDCADEPRDTEAPFFTEAFLYRLLGKEAARTVLAYIHAVERATGT